MDSKMIKTAAIALAAAAIPAATPAMAAPATTIAIAQPPVDAQLGLDGWNKHRHRGYNRGYYGRGYRDGYRDHYYRDGYRYNSYRGDRLYTQSRVWRGHDGRYYCRRDNGTTGLLIGAAIGGVIGNQVAQGRDTTLGTLLGAVGGGLIGKSVDSGYRCR